VGGNGNGTATLAGTPRGTRRRLSLKFLATSSIGIVTEAFTLTVAQAASCHEWQSAKAVRGHTFSFTFKSTGYPVATITGSGSVTGMTLPPRATGPHAIGQINRVRKVQVGITAKNSVVCLSNVHLDGQLDETIKPSAGVPAHNR